jgi:hypothetical protein
MEFENKLMEGLGRIKGLGEIDWKDQATERLAGSGIGVGIGFGVGLLLSALFPSARMTRGTALAIAATAAGISVASSLIPAEGKFFDKLSFFAGGTAGAKLAYAAVGK